MKRIVSTVAVLTVAAFLSQPAVAQITQTPLGGFLYGGGGNETFLAWKEKKDEGNGATYTGQLGLMFSEPVTVYSLSVDLHTSGGNRAIPGTVRVYTSRFDYKEFTFEAATPNLYGTYTLDFGPNGIQADNSYVMVVMYEDGMVKRGDSWTGINPFSISAQTTSLFPDRGADVNVHDTANGILTSMTFLEGTTPPPNGGDAKIAYDGLIHSDNKQAGGRDAIFFDGPTNTDGNPVQPVVGLTATYNSPQTLGSIGLGLAGDGNNRATPEYVTVIGTYENGKTTSMDIWLKDVWVEGEWVDDEWVEGTWVFPDVTQYARYALNDTFVDVVSLTLKIHMPGGSYGWLGLTEFQAFTRPIPEPATMCLLALGGAVLWRRRRA